MLWPVSHRDSISLGNNPNNNTKQHFRVYTPHPVAAMLQVLVSRDSNMAHHYDEKTAVNHSITYQIQVQGHLGGQWGEWFDGLIITRESNGRTRLTGPIVDQAALYGLLKKVRDLGLPLLSLHCVEPDLTESKESHRESQ